MKMMKWRTVNSRQGNHWTLWRRLSCSWMRMWRRYRLRWHLSSQHYTSRWCSSCRLRTGPRSRRQSCHFTLRFVIRRHVTAKWNASFEPMCRSGSRCRACDWTDTSLNLRLTGSSGRRNWRPWGSQLTFSQSQRVWAVAKAVLQWDWATPRYTRDPNHKDLSTSNTEQTGFSPFIT